MGDAVERPKRGAVAHERTYPQPIIRILDPDALGVLSEEDADHGEEDGLEGKHQYRDLRGMGWPDVEVALSQEAGLFDRLAAAADLDKEAELIEDERGAADFPDEDLWGLDVGVTSATLALSALGATPARLYGRTDFDLYRFAQVALLRHGGQ